MPIALVGDRDAHGAAHRGRVGRHGLGVVLRLAARPERLLADGRVQGHRAALRRVHHAVLEQRASAATSWRRSPKTMTDGSGSSKTSSTARWSAVARIALDRLGHHEDDRDGLTRRCPLGLEAREVEQVVDDPADPEGLEVDALGEPAGHVGVALDEEGLGQQAERADGGLELVAHVRDEVAADLLEAAALRDVLDHREHAELAPAVVDERRAHLQGAARRAVEVDRALRTPAAPRVGEQLGDRLGRDGVAIAARHELVGVLVAVDDGAGLVAEDEARAAACRASGGAGSTSALVSRPPRWPRR